MAAQSAALARAGCAMPVPRLREQAPQPVEAQLRVNADGRRHEQDVIVTVTARDQEALDTLTIGDQVTAHRVSWGP